MRTVWRLGILLLFVLGPEICAEIRLPRVIGSGMVLQCGRPVPLWGQADPNEGDITVRFQSQTHQAQRDAQGKWRVTLDAMVPSARPASLVIQGRHSRIELDNILVGEVWLCSGQSNMEFSMQHMEKNKRPTEPCLEVYKQERQSALPGAIRLFRVQKKIGREDVFSDGWKVCGKDDLYPFSLVGYYFGKSLHEELNIPIGLIQSAWGGTRIEPWMPLEAAAASEAFAAADASTPFLIDGSSVGKYYDGLIRPLVPFSIRGVIWYQGESNIASCNDSLRYVEKMKALVSGWRGAWDNPAMPFYSVQLAPYLYTARDKDAVRHTTENLPEFWEAQALCLEIPHTGLAVITDLVENLRDIHPSNKWEVGRRLALLALANDYGCKGLVYSGPVFKSMEIRGTKAVLTFVHTGGGLISRDRKELTHFEAAGADGVYHPATAVIDGITVVVSSPEVSAPGAVRFGWHETAMPNLCNKEGLPARPFRTGSNPSIGK